MISIENNNSNTSASDEMLKPNISKISVTYEISGLVTISQYGTNNQYLKLQINQGFTGKFEIVRNAEKYSNGKLNYVELSRETTYFYKSEGRQSIVYDLNEIESGNIAFYVTRTNNENTESVAYGFGHINRGVSIPDEIPYNTSEKFAVTVTDDYGEPVEDTNVIIFINKNAYLKKTDKKGVASFNLNLEVGEYNVVVYAGNNTVTSTLTVKEYKTTTQPTKEEKNNNMTLKENKITTSNTKPKTIPKIIAKSKSFKIKTKNKKYSISLKNNKNKLLKNMRVTLKINGKNYSAKTNSKGVATFKLSKLTKKGIFKAVVKFTCNNYYKSISKSVKIIIKK